MASTKEITAAWWEWQRLTSEKPPGYRQKSEELWWAWEVVENLMDAGSPQAVDLLLALCDTAPSPEDLGSVGAGPLWALFFEHGTRMGTPEGAMLLEAVAAASRQHPTFRAALSSVWYESDYVPETVSDPIPGMPVALDKRPPTEPEPIQRQPTKVRRPGRPPPTRRQPS